MIHLIFNNTIYLNIDNYKGISVEKNKIALANSEEDVVWLNICEHPKVKELVAEAPENEKEGLQTYICYKVLELIIDRLAKVDNTLPPIINLESALNNIRKGEAKQPAEVIPVTTDAEGNVTKVIKEDE